MGGGILTLILISGLIFKQFKEKKKANLLLNEQNEEISSQRDKIEIQNEDLAHKNDHIMSSIQYAKRIQEGILPSDELIIVTYLNLLFYISLRMWYQVIFIGWKW